MPSFILFPLAAILEIAGCFAVWAWWRSGASALWLIPGFASLAAFAFVLALSPSISAGRAFAAYGGVYILASLLWMAIIEKATPDRYDLMGAAICLAGAAVILYAPRA